LSYAIAKRIVKIPFISLVNLVVNRLLVRELIQSECNQAELTSSLREILSENGRTAILSGYDELIEKLGGKGASEKVASLIHKRTHA
jgi:lipid-A-disaccharide synthase